MFKSSSNTYYNDCLKLLEDKKDLTEQDYKILKKYVKDVYDLDNIFISPFQVSSKLIFI